MNLCKKISIVLSLSTLVASVPINTFASERAPDYVHHNMYKQENSIVMFDKSVVCAPGTGPATANPGGGGGGGGSGAGGSNTVAADSTGAQVYNYLLEKGLSPVQALGIIGNLMQESGDKTLNLNTSASNGPSIGIAQWEGTRRYGTTTSSLQGFAASQGKPMTDLGVQMDFMWHELNTTYKKNTLDPILASNTLEQSTSIFLNQYERPKVRDLQNRLDLANAAAQQLGVDTGSAAATQPTAPAASSLSASSTTVDCTPADSGGGGGGGGGAAGEAPASNQNGSANIPGAKYAYTIGSTDYCTVDNTTDLMMSGLRDSGVFKKYSSVLNTPTSSNIVVSCAAAPDLVKLVQAYGKNFTVTFSTRSQNVQCVLRVKALGMGAYNDGGCNGLTRAQVSEIVGQMTGNYSGPPAVISKHASGTAIDVSDLAWINQCARANGGTCFGWKSAAIPGDLKHVVWSR